MKYFTVTTPIVLGLAFTAGLLGLVADSSPYQATSADSSLTPAACSVIYSGDNGWVVDMCPDPQGGAQMEVVLDDISHGGAGFVRVSHQSQAWPGLPQVAVFYAAGFVRLKPNADPSPAIPFGSSFVLGPAYWSGSVYHHHPQLTRLDIDTARLPEGPLRLRAEGANQDLAVAYDMTLPPARDRQTRLHVIQTYTATTNITIDPARRTQREGFKLVQVSSMFVNQGGACDGDNTDCHDSNGARFIGNDLARHQVAFTAITPSAFVFSSTVPLGSTWFDALHTDDQSWQGNTPNVRIALDALPNAFTITPQGWISTTTDPNDDNVGLWLHDDGPASQSWAAGQRGQIGYWLIAQDNPPDPWADLGLRTGLTFLDFENSYNCFLVQDIHQATTGVVSAISGYADRALQMSYALGAEHGNWVQIRCNFNPPLDLSANDHLRLDWRGDPAAANSLQVGLIDSNWNIFARGYHHPAQRAWWGQLVIPFGFLGAWTPGATFDPSQVSAVIISVVLDPVDDVGGAGRIAVDNLSAYNVISRTVPGLREPVRGNHAASTAAANWIATRQRSTGLVKSWEEETICNAHTYDQALALIVFAREGKWAQADALVDALVRVQAADGSWSKSHNCDTMAPVDGTKWEGDIAWAVYALSRYLALGGAHPGANAAMLKGAAWLADRVSPTDGCLVIDHTEATLDAWWAFQSAGPDYAGQAAQIKSCLLANYWDESMGRFKGGRNWWQPYLDNQTWGAAFLRAIREEYKSQRALSYARQVLLTPAQGGQLFGFDGQGGPWSVWNEGTGQYIAVCGAGARDFLTELLAQQRADGAMPGSPDEFSGGGVWTTRWHGIAPTAWLYNAMNGEPFGAATQCHSTFLPIALRN